MLPWGRTGVCTGCKHGADRRRRRDGCDGAGHPGRYVERLGVAEPSIDIPNPPGNFVAVSPDGRLAYVTDPQDGKVFPVDLTTSPATVGAALSVGGNPEGVAFAPDGATAYVAENANTGGSAELIPITVATGAVGTPITDLGPHPFSIAVTPDGQLALVGDSSNGDVYPVSLPSGAVGTPIAIGGSVHGIARSARRVGRLRSERELRHADRVGKPDQRLGDRDDRGRVCGGGDA